MRRIGYNELGINKRMNWWIKLIVNCEWDFWIADRNCEIGKCGIVIIDKCRIDIECAYNTIGMYSTAWCAYGSRLIYNKLIKINNILHPHLWINSQQYLFSYLSFNQPHTRYESRLKSWYNMGWEWNL